MEERLHSIDQQQTKLFEEISAIKYRQAEIFTKIALIEAEQLKIQTTLNKLGKSNEELLAFLHKGMGAFSFAAFLIATGFVGSIVAFIAWMKDSGN